METRSEWSANVAIVVEGVLKASNDANPIMSGVLLYRSLCQTHRVSLIIDSMAKEKVQYWLRINGLIEHAAEIYYEITDPEKAPERRDQQIKRMKQNGPVTFLVESDPSVAEKMLNVGVPTLLYVHPLYTRPEHRPGFKEEISPWESLLNTVITERELRASDTRIHDDF